MIRSRHWPLVLAAGLVLALVAAPPVAAQEDPEPAGAPPAEMEITAIDLGDFPEVSLDVAATGPAADALDNGDVSVTEGGEEQDAEVGSRSTEVVDVALAVDVSGSMEGDPLEQAKAAARTFVNELPEGANVAVIGFGDTASLVSGLTTDRAATLAAIDGLTAGGETALFDAVSLAAAEVAASGTTRTGVVVLSDGADTVSGTDLAATAGTLDTTDAEFFAVSLRSPESDEAALGSLAEAADGTVIGADNPGALTEAYRELSQRLVNRYEITYTSTATVRIVDVTLGAGGAETSTELTLPASAVATTAPPEQAVPAPRPVEIQTGPADSNAALWVGVALIAVALGALTAVTLGTERRPRRVRRSLRSDAPERATSQTSLLRSALESARRAVTRISSRAVERAEQEGAIDAALDRAGLAMRAGEFVAAVAGTAVLVAVVLWLLAGGVVAALVGVVVTVVGAPQLLRLLAHRRNKAFSRQLGDALMLLAGSMRAGVGIGQAIDNLAAELDPPMSTELDRAILETRLGREIEDGLAGVARRMNSKDLAWVVDAIRVHREVGGNLTRILEQVAEKIRVRAQLRRKVDALTAEGRMSAIVLGVLPIGMALVMYATNPEYLDPLFSSSTGLTLLAVGVGLLLAGFIWLRKLITVGGA